MRQFLLAFTAGLALVALFVGGQVAAVAGDLEGAANVTDEKGVTVNGSDGAAIQAAIDALPAKGGQITLRARTYSLSEPVVIDRDNVSLRGAGPRTLLRLANGANSPVLIVGDTSASPANIVRNVQITDLQIDGNRANQPDECWGGICDVSHVIRNNGITVRGARDILVENVMVKDARSGGLVTEKGCQRITVRQFTAANSQFDGLAGYETEDSVFTGLHLHDNLAAGLSFDLNFDHNIVSDVIITDCGTVGVFIRYAESNAFSSIQIRGSSEHGVFIAENAEVDPDQPAVGNVFTGLVSANNGGHGFRVNDASCTQNSIVGGQFADNAGDCVSEAAADLVIQSGVVCR